MWGNCKKKELDFQDVLENKFGHKKLCEFLLLLHRNEITVANEKTIMMMIIDGDTRMPQEIADDLGLTRSVDIDSEVKDAVKLVVAENPDIVKKILEGNDRPIMSLVGKAMKAVNRKGDPVVIKSLIAEAIEAKRPSHEEKSRSDER